MRNDPDSTPAESLTTSLAVPASLTERQEQPANLRDFLEQFERRKWMALAVFLSIMGITVLTIVRTFPLYEARATMMLATRDQTSIFARGGGMVWPTRPIIGNYLELLRSRNLAERVATRLPDSLRYGQLQGMISVRSVRDTDIIQLVATAPSRTAAVVIVNAYAETYRDFDLEQIRGDISAVLDFLDEQSELVGARLDSAEEALARYKSANLLVSLDTETRSLVGAHSQLDADLRRTVVDAQANEARLAYIRDRIAQEGAVIADRIELSASPMVASLRAALYQLEIERVNLMARGFDDSSERVRGLEIRIDSTRSRLRQESQALISQQGFADPVGQIDLLYANALAIETEQFVSEARQQALKTALSQYEASMARLPRAERELVALSREVETDRRVNALIDERREEARIQEIGRTASVRVIDLAYSARKVRPNVQSMIGFGLVLGLMLALGAVWVAEHLDTAVRSPRELERRGYPVLAHIPEFPRNRFVRNRKGEEFYSHLIPHGGSEASSAAEAFRMLRTALSFAGFNKPHQVILVTSPGPGEGKTTTAVNLGAVLAQSGVRVLLIDGDLRHPMLHRALGLPRKPGLTDLVLSPGGIDGVVVPTTVERLYCLPAGKIPPSPADLLTATTTRELVARLAAEYDCVIIDTPPVLIASDTPIIASMADVALIVVRIGRTTRDALEHARVEMLNTGCQLPGLVINAIDPSSRYGRYYYYYKYSYKYHYVRRRGEPEPGPEAEDREADGTG